ncbi:MAG: sulfide-dependent adenosine diphosphate thiazole synthase [Candidatus Omnitrophica bacterium]|nr:sulfide-dependent adenosine diphosphate thiazole synthase [Candidatus Omnitrophota bacterium]MBU1923009.1 sulfide-dependent adenosine diphosphate thiazole synthase [Candidatus Omnitrophota bacterium]
MFKKISEAQVSRAIVGEFTRWFTDYIVSDVIIIGGGPSGLIAGRELARDGYKTLIVESNNYIGGGFWIGGYLMNPLTFRAPSQEILDELKIPYKEVEDGLFVADGPNACSKLISASCDAGVRILNMTKFDDVVLRNNRVEGVVINWTPVSALPRAITCVDPISMESKLVIDATGHDAWVCKSLEKRKLLNMETFGPMDINVSEDAVVEKTGEVYPGLLVCGMAVSTVYGLPRMGPTFGSMLYSGKKVAVKAKELLTKQSSLEKDSVRQEFVVT